MMHPESISVKLTLGKWLKTCILFPWFLRILLFIKNLFLKNRDTENKDQESSESM